MARSTTSYAADDAGIAIESLEFLHSDAGAALRDAAARLFAGGREPTIAEIERLRKGHEASHVHAALTLARLEQKTHATGPRGKLSELRHLWAVPEALEQATNSTVARFKAGRYAAAFRDSTRKDQPAAIVDLCAGIGGDTLALAEVARVTAVERSPVRSRCLQYNAEDAGRSVEVITADVRAILPQLPSSALFHIDPSRRSGSVKGGVQRSPQYADLIPGPDVLEAVIAHFAGGGIKLSPAVDFDTLPPGHLELISHQSSVVQAMLWTGSMAAAFPQGTRTATVLSEPHSPFSYSGVPERGIPTPAIEWHGPAPLCLYEADGTLTRAGLAYAFAQDHSLQTATPDGGYLVGPAGQSGNISPVLTGFEVVKVVPYSEKRVATVLRDLAAADQPKGGVEVKSRGRVPGVDTDKLQAAWAKVTSQRWTVLIFDYSGDVLAVIARRIRK